MYKQIDTDKPFTDCTGRHIEPIATLSNGYGDRVQITEDDHCIVCFLTTYSLEYKVAVEQVDAEYKPITHLFPELFEFLKMLPTPQYA